MGQTNSCCRGAEERGLEISIQHDGSLSEVSAGIDKGFPGLENSIGELNAHAHEVKDHLDASPDKSGNKAALEAENAEQEKDDLFEGNLSSEEIRERAEKEVADFLQKHQVLEAEIAMARAVKALESIPYGEGEVDLSLLQQTPVFEMLTSRVRRLETVARCLETDNFTLAWETGGSHMSVYCPSGSTWFQYKLVTDLEAPLTHCLAYTSELDLVSKYEPMVLQPPELLGPFHPLLLCTRTLLGFGPVRCELLMEIQRYCDAEYGWFAESITSDFPRDERPVPDRAWRNVRISVDTQNLWIPHGGGKQGTVAIQLTKVELGVSVPEWLLKTFFQKGAAGLVENLRKTTSQVGEEGSPYHDRLEQDATGLYGMLKQVEDAAAKRHFVSEANLPGPELLFDRPHRIL